MFRASASRYRSLAPPGSNKKRGSNGSVKLQLQERERLDNQEREDSDARKEREFQALRRTVQLTFSNGSVKKKNVREMTEVYVDVKKLRNGCFFSEKGTTYSLLARYIEAKPRS